jgi:TIR domain-containing protein
VTSAISRIFVSYRIDDGACAAGAVADRLAARFGKANVFRDRDSLFLGSRYPKKIRRALGKSDVVVAMIGPSWLDIRDGAGRRRLDEPSDWVRIELRTAFEKEIPVVPVLLDHTPLPQPDRLPVDLVPLSRSTCWHVRRETFDSDVRGLIDGIAGVTDSMPPPPPIGTNKQHNHASGRGQIITNQGTGNQTVNFGRNPR